MTGPHPPRFSRVHWLEYLHVDEFTCDFDMSAFRTLEDMKITAILCRASRHSPKSLEPPGKLVVNPTAQTCGGVDSSGSSSLQVVCIFWPLHIDFTRKIRLHPFGAPRPLRRATLCG